MCGQPEIDPQQQGVGGHALPLGRETRCVCVCVCVWLDVCVRLIPYSAFCVAFAHAIGKHGIATYAHICIESEQRTHFLCMYPVFVFILRVSVVFILRVSVWFV